MGFKDDATSVLHSSPTESSEITGLSDHSKDYRHYCRSTSTLILAV